MRGYVYMVRSRDPLRHAPTFSNRKGPVNLFSFGEWLTSLLGQGTGVIFAVPTWGRYDGVAIIDTDYYQTKENEEVEAGKELATFDHCLAMIRNNKFVSDTTTMISINPMNWASNPVPKDSEGQNTCFAVLAIDTEVGASRRVCDAIRKIGEDHRMLVIHADAVLGSNDIIVLVRRPTQLKFYSQFIEFRINRMPGVIRTDTEFVLSSEWR